MKTGNRSERATRPPKATKTRMTPAEQQQRFKEAARELGTDDDPERFKETVRKLAKAPPAKSGAKPRKTPKPD